MVKARLFGRVDLCLVVSILIFSVVLPTTLAAPHSSSQKHSCTPSACRSQDSKLRYEEGKSYLYDFESESVTKIVGTTEEPSKLKVKGQAVLAALSPCDITLTIQQASIQTPSGQAVSRVDGLEGSSVRFAYQDGDIEGLCVSDNDATWSANIKRALVSALQNKAINNAGESLISEDSISGRCPTQYTVYGDRYVKTRNLNACVHREGGSTVERGVAYNVPSKLNSIPGVNSTFECTQNLRNGVFQSVSCEESHKLEAFSRNEAGAQTTVKSSMNLVSIENGLKGAKASEANKASSIFYDHGDSQDSQRQKSASSNTQDIIKKLCLEVDTGAVSSKVPGLFLQLKKALKFAQAEDLISIRRDISSTCPKASRKLNKLLLDAAAMSASDGAIGLLANVYTADEMPVETKSYFYIYTTFVNQPGTQALSAMSQLLKTEKNPENRLLLASTGLAYQYCKMTNPACGDESQYIELVNNVARHAGNNCASKNQDKIEKAVAALSSLSSLSVLTDEAVTSITQCLENGSERIQIRALDAYRRDPCQTSLKEKAKTIFADRKKSSEIRIKAYLAASKCLQLDDVESMQKIITKEKSNQVNSFIASHIRNQIESSGPEKQEQKSLLRRFELPTIVPEDVRKFSKNYELSSFSPEMNLGGALESNLIFSQDSFVPRVATLNSTLHAFGRSYNLLEMGLYVEDFEHVLEKYFGPNGKVKSTNFNEIIKNGREQIGNAFNSRLKRSPQPIPTPDLNDNEVQVYQNEVEIENRYGHNGVGDVYVRIMGTSVLVDSLSQDKLGRNSMADSMKDFVDKVLQGAKDHKVDLTQPILFLDDEITVPTISGFPLNLNLEGTTVLSLQLEGNVDFVRLMKKDGGEIQTTFVPSSATVLKARMSTGAGPIEAGVQLEGKIHSSAGVEASLKRQKGQFDIKINLPQEKTQLLDVRTDLYFVEQQAEQLEKKSPVTTKVSQKNSNSDCYVSDVLGLRFCSDIKMPSSNGKSPHFPLSGPSIVSVGIEKTDNGMKGYHARIISQLEDKDEKSISILLDTPGSKMNRKIEAQGKLKTSPTVKLELDVDSPWNKFKAFYEHQNTESLKALDLGVSNDDKDYALKLQMKMSGASDARLYEPLVQYTSPSGVRKYVEGTVKTSEGKVRLDVKTDNSEFRALHGRITADIKVHSQDQSRNYDLSTIELDYPSWGVGKLGLTGNLKVSEPAIVLKGVATYGESSHSVSIDSTVTRVSKQRYNLDAHVKSPSHSGLNFDLNWEAGLEKKTDALVHKFQLTHGEDSNKLTVSQNSYFNTESSRNFDIVNELSVQKPSSDLSLSLKANAKKISDASQVYEFQARSGSTHQVHVKISGGPDAYFNYNLKAAVEYPGQSYEFVETAKKVEADSWRYDTKFTSTPGNEYVAVTDLKLKDDRNDAENTISTTITSNAFSQPIIFKTGVIKKPKSNSAHLLLESKGTRQVDIETSYKQTGINKPHAINVKAFVNKYLDATLNENHTSTTSNLHLNAHWLPSDRKIGAQSVLRLQQGEILSLDGELKWDVDRDNSKYARIQSVTTLPKNNWLIDSKNDVTIEGRNSKLNLKGKITNDLWLLDFAVIDANEKKLDLHVKNMLEFSLSRVKSSKLNAKLELLDSNVYELEWENRLNSIDLDKYVLDVSSDFKFNYEQDQNLNVALQFNSVNPGSKRIISGHFGVDLPQNIKSGVSPLAYDFNTEWKKDQIKTSMSAKHGTKASALELTAKLDKQSAKKTADLTYKVTLPINPKSLEGTMKYTYAFNSWSNFELTEQGSVSINNKQPTTWNQVLRTQNNEIEALVNVVDEGSSIVNVSLNARNHKSTVVDFTAQANGLEGRFHTVVEGQFPLNTIRASGGFSKLNSNKKYDFKLNHLNAQGGQSFETNLNVNQNGERFVLSNKFENFNKRKSLDLLFTDGKTPRKVFFVLTETTPRYNLDSFIKWGEGGRSITTKGSLDTGNDNIDAVFSIDSEALKIDKWSARVSKKNKSGRNSIAVDIEGQNEKKVSAKVDYAKKSERSGDTYDGSLNLHGTKVNFNGNFRLENGVLDKKRDGEEGRQVKAMVQLAGNGVPLKLSMLAKKSNQEKRATVSFCNENDEDCKIADVQFRHEKHENNDVDYMFKATTQFVSSGKKTIDGILLKASRGNNGQQYEHVAQLIINEEKNAQIGYKVFQRVGKEIGFEVQLPQRIVSAVATADRSPGHDKAEVSLWMDKVRKPDDRLTVVFSLDTLPKTKDNAEGVKTLISLQYPAALTQELKFKSTLVQGGNKMFFMDLDAELDIFKKSEPIHLAFKATKESKRELYIQQQVEIPALNWESKSETKITPEEVSHKSSVTYKSQEGQTKKSKVDFSLTEAHSNLVINTPNSKPLISFATDWKNKEKHGSSGYDVRYEILVPGMSNKTIIESHLSTASPPHANLKMYSSQGNSEEFYEAYIGFRNEQQFAAGIYEQSDNGRNAIGALNIALNSSRLLFVKADWETKNMDTVLAQAQQQWEDAGVLFKEVFNAYMDESSQDSQFLLTSVTKAMPNLKPIFQAYKNELKQIREELRDNEDTKAINNYIMIAERLVAEYSYWVSDLWMALADIMENWASRFSDLVSTIPKKWSSLKEQIPDYVKSVKETFNAAVDSAVDGASRLVKEVRKAMKSISSSLKQNVNLDFLNDTTNGIGKYLNDAVSFTVNGVTRAIEFARSTTVNIIQSSYVKSVLTKSLARYENLLAAVVEETKIKADTLREYIMSAFPQQETQDLILAMFQYAEKKAQRIPVNDSEMQRDIYKKLVTAVRKLGSEIWTIDWQNGLIIARIPLPKPINSLMDMDQLLKFDIPSLSIKKHAIPFNYGVTEFYNFVKADSLVNTVYRSLFATESSIPPVPAYALLVGSMYIRTFDGSFYHFTGNCQYLLASDFVEQNFTLAINFLGDGPKVKKSIIVKYAGETVVINPDFSTEVKNKRSNEMEHLKIDDSEQDTVTVTTKNGALTVSCQKRNDVCVFGLNGYYHGKVMGLLGTNNNEAHDDYRSPSNGVLENSNEFVASWKLNKQCEERSFPSRPVASRSAQQECSKAFADKYSPLRSCYGLIDPMPFKSVCESLSSEKGYEDAKKAVCSSSIAYSETCSTSLIRVEVPSFC